MSLLTNNKFISCDLLCSKLMQSSDVLFSGFVNSRGKLLANGKNNSLNFYDEKNLEMFIMEIALDFSMKREFNEILGKVEYAVTKRKNSNVLCIPMSELILVMITDNQVSMEEIVKKVYHILSKFTKVDAYLRPLLSPKIVQRYWEVNKNTI